MFKKNKKCKHKFQARYDEKHFEPKEGEWSTVKMCDKKITFFPNRIYVHDICIKCGKIIKR